MTPANWATRYSRQGGVSLLNSGCSLEADSSPMFGPIAELGDGPTCFCPSLRATSLPYVEAWWWQSSLVLLFIAAMLQHSSHALTASRIPHSGRNSFPTCPGLLSAVIHPAREVAILLVKTLMTSTPPARLELWQHEFQWHRLEAWLQLSFPFEATSTWTIDQQTVLECLVAWHVLLSVRIHLVKTNSVPLSSDSQTFSNTGNVCRNSASLISASLTCSGSNSAPVNSWMNFQCEFLTTLASRVPSFGLERVASSPSALLWPSPSHFHKYQSFISMSQIDSLLQFWSRGTCSFKK